MTTAPLPPGPSEWMPMRIYHMWSADPLEYMLGVAQQYGDIAFMRLGARQLAQVNHPDYIQDILVTHRWNFSKTRNNEQEWRDFLGVGLLDSEGDFHLHERRIMEPAFRHDRIAAYGAMVADYAVRQSQRWAHGASLDIHQEMLRLTLAIAGKAFLDADMDSREADDVSRSLSMAYEMYTLLKNPLAHLLEKLPLPSVRHFREARQLLDGVIYRKIEARRQQTGALGDDVLGLLFGASGAEGGLGRLTDARARDEALTTLLAGHETTANALTFAWMLLAQHPEAEAKLHAELDSVLGGRLPTPGDVARLPYTEAVVAESMRLYPPVWCEARQCVADYVLGGFRIPADTILLWSLYNIHRDRRWFNNPEKFDPDRLRREERAKLHRFVYFPFGAGPHQCIGEPFAWMVGVMVIATLAQRWHMRLAPGYQLVLEPQVSLRPKTGMPMTLQRREATG